MLRIHFLQQWFDLSDLRTEEALFKTTLCRKSSGFSSVECVPDRVSILRFQRLLEVHQVAPQLLAVVNAIHRNLSAVTRHSAFNRMHQKGPQ